MGEDTFLETIIKYLKPFFCKHDFEWVDDDEDRIGILCYKCNKRVWAKK